VVVNHGAVEAAIAWKLCDAAGPTPLSSFAEPKRLQRSSCQSRAAVLLGSYLVRAYNNIESGGKLLALVLICILALLHGSTVELYFGATLAV